MAGERTLPGLNLTAFWNAGSNGWKPAMDSNIQLLSAVVQLSVISRVTALPASPAEGDIYLVPSGAAENANKVALYDNGAWVYLTPKKGFIATVSDENIVVWYSGTAWVSLPTGAPYDIGGSYIGQPTDALTILRYPIVRSVRFPATLSGSRAVSAVAASAKAVFSVRKNGVDFGTFTFAAGTTVATFTGTATTLSAGAVLTVVAPSTADSTLSDIGFALTGTRL